jgi:hypothetical protein
LTLYQFLAYPSRSTVGADQHAINSLTMKEDQARKQLPCPDAHHVGIGTDLFGLRDRTAVPTHTEFALIPAGLLNRGYDPTDIAKIVGGNFMRIFRQASDKI